MTDHEPVGEPHARVRWSLVDGECFTQGWLERSADHRRVQEGESRAFASVADAVRWGRSAAAYVEVSLDGDGRRFWAGDGPPPAGMAALADAPLLLVDLVTRQWGRHRARTQLPGLEEIRARYQQLFPRWRRGGVEWELHGRVRLSVVGPSEVEQVELLELAEELGFKDPVIEPLVLSTDQAGEIDRVLRGALSDDLHLVRVDTRTGEVELFIDESCDAAAAVAVAAARFPEQTFVARQGVSRLTMSLGYFGDDLPPDLRVIW